jgi:uncharacterized protein YigE (DUF2233 family)
MTKRRVFAILVILQLILLAVFIAGQYRSKPDDFISYKVDVKKEALKMYWKDDNGMPFKNFQQLRQWLEDHGQQLVFAMNGGMFKPDYTPVGLFIQEYKTISPLDTTTGPDNFYLKPNGVFYLTADDAVICKTEDFSPDTKVKYATQSGPMLVIDGQIHPAFNKSSTNLNVRNGVGILPDKKVVFAMSRREINLFEFANYFKKLGCSNALYLDGFVSKTYLPAKNWMQVDGNFCVIIAVSKPRASTGFIY